MRCFVYVHFTSWRPQVQGSVISQEGSGCSGSSYAVNMIDLLPWVLIPEPLFTFHEASSWRIIVESEYSGLRERQTQLSGSREGPFTMAWPQHVTWRVPHNTQDLPFKLVLSSNATSGHVNIVYPTAQAHIAHWFHEEINLNSNIYGFSFQQGHSMWTWGWAAGW